MEEPGAPQIHSFVIRFICPIHMGEAVKVEYRGSISHVQTDEQVAFTRWTEAVEFIHRFIPGLEDDKTP